MKRVLAAAAALLFLPVMLLAAAVGALGGADIGRPLGTTVGAHGANGLAVAAAQAGFSGQGLRLAVAVGLAESGGNPHARNPNPPTPGCPTGSLDRGAWQLNHCYHPEVIDACADDLACAAEATYRISAAGSDWNAWTTYTSGAYRAQLAAADHAIAALVVTGIPSGFSGAELGDLVPCRPGIGIFAACPVLPDRREPSCSACRRGDPQAVAVRVPKGDLACPRRLLHGHAELGPDGIDITDAQVDEGSRTDITGVFGQEQPRGSTRDRHERRQAWLKAVLPLLGEPQARIPGDRGGGVGDVKDRDGFLVHATTTARTKDRPSSPRA